MNETSIYTLTDEQGIVRYVGKTSFDLARRLKEHLQEARRGKKSHRCNWIRSLVSRGLAPTIKLVDTVQGNGNVEEIALIAKYRADGMKLVNGTHGGDGIPKGHKFGPQSEDQIMRGKDHWNYGNTTPDEVKKKISEANKGKPPTFRGRKHSDEAKEKISAVHKGKTISEEHRKAIIEFNTGRWIGREVSKETREKIAKSAMGNQKWLGKKHSEESKAKMRKPRTEEQIQRIREAQQKRRERERSALGI